MTEQLLQQQLESPSGTGRVEPRSNRQPHTPLDQRTGCQPTNPILTGSSARADNNRRPARASSALDSCDVLTDLIRLAVRLHREGHRAPHSVGHDGIGFR